MAPKKKTVGTANAWIANQRNVKIGYATERLKFLFIKGYAGDKSFYFSRIQKKGRFILNLLILDLH